MMQTFGKRIVEGACPICIHVLFDIHPLQQVLEGRWSLSTLGSIERTVPAPFDSYLTTHIPHAWFVSVHGPAGMNSSPESPV